MGRHTSAGEAPLQQLGTQGLGTPARLGLVAAAVVVVIGAGVLVAPENALSRLPWAAKAPCDETTVDMLVEPELRAAIVEIVQPLQGEELPGGDCAKINVREQQGVETVAAATVIPPDRAPQIWIPDSPTWVEQVPNWPMQQSDPLASSPVVVATSKAAAVHLGWAQRPPTWDAVLRGSRPMAVPDIQTEADSLSALIALWQTLGKGPAADQAVVNVVLAADRGQVPSAEEAFAVARSGSVNSPVIPATEQAVTAANRETGVPNMMAVYPAEGSPSMDYPVMRVKAAPETPARAAAADLVLARLRSPEAQAIAQRSGFRSPEGEAGSGEGIYRGPVRKLVSPGEAEVAGMVSRIENLARPSRLLCLIDVSLSMQERLKDGTTRIQLAAAAARLGAELLPDRSSAGAWIFATRMKGDQDWRPLAPVAPLGSTTKTGQNYRFFLEGLTSNVGRYLKGGGTSLYDTTLAASREMHRTYDDKSVNAIILLSDGGNSDSSGATLDQLINELRQVNAGPQKVAIYTAGLGPDADFDALKKIADASGGYSYRIDNALQGQVALLDGLRRSRKLGQ
jgi:ABC-type Fe3+ transport system substrate-binding protein